MSPAVIHACANCGEKTTLSPGFIIGVYQCPFCGFVDWLIPTPKEQGVRRP